MRRCLRSPADVGRETLLRSYRTDEWPGWFAAAAIEPSAMPPVKGLVFDSSSLMVEAAIQGAGVALAPVAMFCRPLGVGLIEQPFTVTVCNGAYWLMALKSRPDTPTMRAFRDCLFAMVAEDEVG